jgi:universal stress protein E
MADIMQNIKSILVIVDPTVEHDCVIDRARFIAKSSNAKVELFINYNNFLTDQTYAFEGEGNNLIKNQSKLFHEHFEQLLTHHVEEFTKEGIDVSYLLKGESHLAEAIIKHAIELKPDLVLKSTHHRSALRRSLVTNTDWRLIRKCPSTLLLVKPNEWQANGSVVTAVDPLHAKAAQTSLDHQLLTYTEMFAGFLKQSACVFHCYFPFVSSMFPLGSESAEHLITVRDKHQIKLNELLANYNIDQDNIHLTHGELISTLITDLKSTTANILVIGALSRNFLERAIVGNTAEKILDDCPCDVLVVKPS